MNQNMGKDYVYELDEVLNRKNKNAVMELIDGVFYDMAAPTGLHQRLIIKIAGCLEAFIERNGGHVLR